MRRRAHGSRSLASIARAGALSLSVFSVSVRRAFATFAAFTTFTIFASGAIALMVPREAEAADCTNPLINTCLNSDTFWPSAGPSRFATIGSTQTVARGNVAFGLMATYLSRPIVLRVASPGPGGSDQYVVNDQVTGNFLFAYGVTDRLALDVALPVTFIQTGAGTSPLTGGEDLRDTAVRDMRFGFAYALVPRKRVNPTYFTEDAPASAWGVATRLGVSAPIGDKSQFAGERSVVLAPSVVVDYRFRRLLVGLDVGLRLRPVTEFAGARVGTQLTAGLGVGYDVLDHDYLTFSAEARTLLTFAEQHDTAQSVFGISSRPNGKMIFPAEWMLVARTAPLLGGDVGFFAGGGGPIPLGDPAITVPRFRFLLGATYAPSGYDSDGDGVLDRLDRCPTRAGVRGGERPGCPSEREENAK